MAGDGTWRNLLPASIKQSDTELANVEKLGGEPAVRVVPNKIEDEDEQPEPNSLSLTLKNGMKAHYRKFGGSPNVEDALRHIQTFLSLARKMNFKTEHDEYCLMKQAQDKEISELKKKPKQTPNKKEKLADLKDKRSETISSIKSIREEYYGLWEQLLEPELHAAWQRIVTVQCETDGYIGKNGIPIAGIRGKTFPAMVACHRAWLVTKTGPGAAERQRHYMQTQIKMPRKGVKVKVFIARLVEMDGYIEFLPCLKDVEDSPAALKRNNVPFDEIEMCMLILKAVPFGLATAYWANQGARHFPQDVSELSDNLELLEPEFGKTQSLLDQVKKANGNPPKNKMGSEKDKIPKKKPKHDKSKNGKGDSGGNHKCERCAKWSPQYKFTHDTEECRRWTEKGMDKRHKFNKNSSESQREREFKTLKKNYAHMEKRTKRLEKQLRNKKKGKKRNYESSDSDSSDSE